MTGPARIICVLMLLGPLLQPRAHAQFKTDSLLRELKTTGPSDELYNGLIWAYVFNKPDSAIFFGNRGLEWCKHHDTDSLIASMYNRIGVAYDVRSMADSALFMYRIAIEEAQKHHNLKTEAGALNNIGLIQWNNGETEKAIDHYIRAADIFDHIGYQTGLASCYNNIALILYDDHQLEKSRRYQFQSLRIREKISDLYGIAASYNNLAELYSTDGMLKPDSAIIYLHMAIPIKQQLKDQFGLARVFHNLGDLYMDQKQLDSAITYEQKALSIQLSLDNTEGYASTYYTLSTIYVRKEDPETSLAYIDSAEIAAQSNNDRPLLWKVYYVKAVNLAKLHRYEPSTAYWKKYALLKDSLVNIERSHQVEELETRYRTSEKNKKLAENKVLLAQAELAYEHRGKWIIGLVGGLASLILLGIVLFEISKRKAQAEKDAALITEREKGLNAMIEATETERKRIAKDLHDGIVQTLTGLSLRLQNVNPVMDGKGLAASQGILNDAIAEVRSISHDMMPRALERSGLIPVIDDMLEKTLGNTDMHYSFEHFNMDDQRFSEKTEICVYRICQELMNNIIKHAGATEVSVQLLHTRTHLVLIVEDNGCGFDMDHKVNGNGIGLTNMNVRANALKGEVTFCRGPEKGTVTNLRLPLS